ncbi:hypothetical protein EDB83DRAFT_2515609 [Lactarius deliciosus]|nr:hypothetical protein EDB83DRAFT_2515609 [Lactarius deliciosus]
MSPHHLFGYRHHKLYNPMFYGPSRFIWFSIGSLATLAWMHHHRTKDACRHPAQIGYDDRFRGHGQREREASPRRFDEQQQQQQQQWGPPPPVAEASGRSPVDREQLDRLREMSRNAEETISGMSEATIDSMMGGLQRLKDRLAERRAQQFQDPQEPLATAAPRAPSPEQSPQPRHWV